MIHIFFAIAPKNTVQTVFFHPGFRLNFAQTSKINPFSLRTAATSGISEVGEFFVTFKNLIVMQVLYQVLLKTFTDTRGTVRYDLDLIFNSHPNGVDIRSLLSEGYKVLSVTKESNIHGIVVTYILEK